MVRGYDPTTSDISTLLWNYIFSFNDHSLLTLPQSQTYVKHWLAHSEQTAALYRRFASLPHKPTIRLRKHCPQSLTLETEGVLKQEYRHFPTSSKGSEITICLSHVANKLQLKQNLDRELTFLYLRGQKEKEGSFEEEERGLMKDLYDSCYSGYRNYRLNEAATKEMSIVCSKYLFFRRSRSTLPLDRKFRYATQLADQLLL